MAERGKTSYVGRLKDDIKKKERIKIELEEKVRKLEEILKDHDENCQTKIHDLEEEIKRLKEEITRLEEEIKEMKIKMEDLEESNTFLEKEANEAKVEIGELKTKLGNLDEKIKKFDLPKDVLVIRQLCSSVQENLSRIVLQEHFNDIQNKRTRYMENYISRQIKDKVEQERARLRWEELQKEIKWDEFLIIQLKSVKSRGNDAAHPPLTEKVIDAAKNELEEKKELGPEMVEAVDQLKDIWEKTNQKLPQGAASVMDEKSKTTYVGRLKDDIKKKEGIKIELEEKVRKLEEKLEDHDENCQTKIHDLEEEKKRLKEEITRLEEENNTLREEIKKLEMKIGDLEESNAFLEKEANEAKVEVGELKTKLGNLNEKIKKFEPSEEELVIKQLCSIVQENLLRIVLQENFDKFQNKRTEDMENYISWQIKDKGEQERARLRWEELKKETKWDEYLLRQLKPVKSRGNETAHPPLTEKDIDDVKRNLKEKKKLGNHMVKAVDQLKVIWIQTNRKLPQGTSSIDREEGDPRIASITGKNHEDIRHTTGTYASKAAGGLGDRFGPKQAMQSFSRPAFQKGHYSGAC